MTYRQYLTNLRLRHFSPDEILRYADQVRWSKKLGKKVKNALPPRELWGNIAPTLWILDNFRAAVGKPIRLTSIYRSPDYNEAVSPGSKGYHLKNSAIDFQVDGMSPTVIHRRLLAIRQAQGFKGGLGKYATFNHIDTRGYNATW